MPQRSLFVVVTGGRDYADSRRVADVLGETKPAMLIHGGCPTGADRLADEWAVEHEVATLRVAAKWATEGKKAGPLRNRRMLKAAKQLADLYGCELVVIAFPGGRGTHDCVTAAHEMGLTVRDLR